MNLLATATSPTNANFAISVAMALIGFYFVPTMIAIMRRHRSTMAIAAVNVLGGWTGIGWLWALIWSLANHGNYDTSVIVRQNVVHQLRRQPLETIAATTPDPRKASASATANSGWAMRKGT